MQYPAEKLKAPNNLAAKVILVLIGMAIAGVALMGYWSFQGRVPIEYKQQSGIIVNKQVKAGEDVKVKLSFCKNVQTTPRVNRYLVSDTQRILLAPTLRNVINNGCYTDLEVQVPIPANTPAGEYYISYSNFYNVNPINNNVRVDYQTERFTVLPQ